MTKKSEIFALRHRLALLANSAERLLNANHQQVRNTFRDEAGQVADDILEARALLQNSAA